jgi:DNA-binding NtrC family response regulator
MATILVVDDELGIRALLSEILTDEGHSVELAEDAAQARSVRERLRPDLVLLDIWMPDVDGITLLKEWGATGLLTMPVIMMSGHGTIDTAVEAIKFGAAAFLEKPVTLQKLLRAVDQGLNRQPPGRGGATSLSPMGEVDGASGVVGHAASTGLAAPGIPGGIGPADSARALSVLVLPSEQAFELDRPLREARDAFEKAYFEFHLAKENGSMTRVAEKTGLERTHLYRKLKQLGVDLVRGKRNA